MTSEAMMPLGRSRCGLRGLLGGGRDHVEADVGEEHDRGAGEDAAARRSAAACRRATGSAAAVRPLAVAAPGFDGGMNGRVVGGVDEADAGDDHEQHDEQLDADQHRG